jgi:hypothetical protein
MKTFLTVFWDVMPCSSVDGLYRFRAVYLADGGSRYLFIILQCHIPEGYDLETPYCKDCKIYIFYFLPACAIIQEVPVCSLNQDDQFIYHEMFMLSEQQYNRMLFYNKQHYTLSNVKIRVLFSG